MMERRNTRGKEGEGKRDVGRYMKIDIDKGDMVTGWLRRLIHKWGMRVKDDGEGVFVYGTVWFSQKELLWM